MIALLVIIYIAFISLGLPDSILGSAWPVMQNDLAAPFPLAGYVTMTVCAGTIISSLFSTKVIHRFGTAKVSAVSVLLTTIALLGYTCTTNPYLLFFWAIPMGIGAGSVDTALNNFVAIHYKAKHMSWLHCFWGIGATAGPMIMSLQLSLSGNWRNGFLTVFVIQMVLTIVLFSTLPLWKKVSSNNNGDEKKEAPLSNREALRIPGVKASLITFIFFCATESTGGLWGSSYLSNVKDVAPADAAIASSLFYGAITLGRMLSGFATSKFTDTVLIRTGHIICIIGTIITILPFSAQVAMVGIFLIGFGTSPIYPSMIHETPFRYGEKNSQAVIGLEMAFAYIGSTLFPSFFGSLAGRVGNELYPYFLLICILVMTLSYKKPQKN